MTSRADYGDALANVLATQPRKTSPLAASLAGTNYTTTGRKTPSSDVERSLQNIYKEYPNLQAWGMEVLDSRAIGRDHPRNVGGGYLEFYHPEESRSPNPGVPTIELFDPEVTGATLQNYLFGDMLHYAPDKIPEFAKLRGEFRETITEEQDKVNRGAYKRYVDEGIENRDYDEWFDRSRLDAFIRGYITEQWTKGEDQMPYSDEQVRLLEKMKETLKK